MDNSKNGEPEHTQTIESNPVKPVIITENDINKVYSPLNKIQSKNVFVFDTETTGLPDRGPNGWGSYWSYNLNEKYDNSRIISIAWSSIHNYNKETINNKLPKIEHFLRYPEGFDEITNSHIHGITYEDTLKDGIPFNGLLMDKGLCVDLLKADYIIAHNIDFDYYILMNELYRLGTEHAQACMLHLSKLKTKNRCICTGAISTNICKMEFANASTYKGKNAVKRYKMPKLSELYVYYYGKEFENQHSANGEVKALLEIMAKM